MQFDFLLHFLYYVYSSAQNIHTEADWDIVFTILECVGAGATPPEFEDIIVPNFGKKIDSVNVLPSRNANNVFFHVKQ